MRRLLLLCTVLAVLAPTAPAIAQTAPDYVVVDPAFQALEGAQAHWGIQTVDGVDSGYRIEVPDDWNGTLVLYAHGFVGAAEPDLVVQNPSLRELFIAQGFAWAASSYSRNGYTIDAAVEETHALLDGFADLTGGAAAPTDVLFHGVSMGGHITGAAIERRPDAYDGALPICGVMGDIELFDYFTDVNLVAGALAGVPVPVPGDLSFIQGPAQAIDAALGLQAGLTAPAGHQYAAVIEQRSGGERPLVDEALTFWNSLAAVDLGEAGRVPFLQAVYSGILSAGIDDPAGIDPAVGNADRVYSYDGEPAVSPAEADLNGDVTRVAASTPPPFPVIDGDITIPVLTLHTLGDLFVPFSMQQTYAEEAAAAGAADLLVQRAIRAVGHCEFTGEELATAFTDLVAWVARDGAQPPAGDDVTDATVVADHDYGCAFTSETRPGLPACGTAARVMRAPGSDRVATAVALSQVFPGAGSVVLARADDYADALAGAALAGALDAPLLVTGSGALDDRVADEIARLGATTAVVLGGPSALSQAVAEGALAAGASTVHRVQGGDRFATAAAIAGETISAGGDVDEVFIARGAGGFADAVAVSGLAAFVGQPVLLVGDGLPGPTAAAIEQLGVTGATIVGGVGAVSAETEAELVAAGVDTERLAGGERYATSAAVAGRAVASGASPNGLVLATGAEFADALAAGPAAASLGDVLVIVDGADLDGSEATAALLDGVVTTVIVAGGSVAVSDATILQVEEALTG